MAISQPTANFLMHLKVFVLMDALEMGRYIDYIDVSGDLVLGSPTRLEACLRYIFLPSSTFPLPQTPLQVAALALVRPYTFSLHHASVSK